MVIKEFSLGYIRVFDLFFIIHLKRDIKNCSKKKKKCFITSSTENKKELEGTPKIFLPKIGYYLVPRLAIKIV